jgi:hypothetical protein
VEFELPDRPPAVLIHRGNGYEPSRSVALPADALPALIEALQKAAKIVRINGTYEVLARAVNLIIARGAYREAACAGSGPEDIGRPTTSA